MKLDEFINKLEEEIKSDKELIERLATEKMKLDVLKSNDGVAYYKLRIRREHAIKRIENYRTALQVAKLAQSESI